MRSSIEEKCDLILSVRENKENSNKQLICKNFLPNVNRKVSTGQFLQKLFSCKRNADRVNVVLEHFKWTPLHSSIRGKYTKSSSISSLFRQWGNSAREEGKLDDSIQLLTMAILFAPATTPELGLAYASRSVVLQELNLINEAIQDIDLALENSYPTERELKLVKRRKRYENLLAKQVVTEATACVRPCESKKSKGRSSSQSSSSHENEESFFSIKRANPVMPCADSAINLMVDPEHGRHLIANRSIEIGSPIIVETPFVAALESATSWDVQHCHHCLRKLSHGIPCSSCVFAIYCQEKCRLEAQRKYHRYECPCMPEIHCNLDDPLLHNFYLVFKLICQIGPDELYARFQQHGHGQDEPILKCAIPGCDPITGLYDSSTYETVYNLMSTVNAQEGYYFVLVAIIMSYTLRWNSDFFAHIDDQDVESFQAYIATLMLHHFEGFRRNLFSFEQVLNSVQDGGNDCKHEDDMIILKNYAVGVLPTMSLLNHSCDPNAVLVTSGAFGKSAIVTVRRVREGEQLLISYGPHYGDCQGTSSRRETLEIAYGFMCKCNACFHDWSSLLLKQLSGKEPYERSPHFEFICSLCMKFHGGNSNASRPLIDGSTYLKCTGCKRQFKKSILFRQLERYKEVVTNCERLIHIERKPSKATPLLIESLHFFEINCRPPCYYSVMAQKLLRDALALLSSGLSHYQ